MKRSPNKFVIWENPRWFPSLLIGYSTKSRALKIVFKGRGISLEIISKEKNRHIQVSVEKKEPQSHKKISHGHF